MSFNDHLVSTFYATKTNANSVTTFLAFDQGYIAQFLGGQPYFYFGPSLPKARNYFDPTALMLPPPRVDIIYAHRRSLSKQLLIPYRRIGRRSDLRRSYQRCTRHRLHGSRARRCQYQCISRNRHLIRSGYLYSRCPSNVVGRESTFPNSRKLVRPIDFAVLTDQYTFRISHWRAGSDPASAFLGCGQRFQLDQTTFRGRNL